MYGLHHGLMMGLLLPFVMDFNLMACPQRFIEISRAMNINSEGLSLMEIAWKTIEVVMTLLKLLKVPSLKDLAIEKTSFDHLAEIAMQNLGTMDNPRKMSKEGFTEILTNAYHHRFITKLNQRAY